MAKEAPHQFHRSICGFGHSCWSCRSHLGELLHGHHEQRAHKVTSLRTARSHVIVARGDGVAEGRSHDNPEGGYVRVVALFDPSNTIRIFESHKLIPTNPC